jgi:hypothetical protein
MIAAKKISGKPVAEMFDDIPVLQRKWHAALRPGERLPRYEDVMLGSLGRLADHVALLRSDGALELSRSGRYVQKWLGEERWDIPVAALAPDCATALSEAAASALGNGRPHLASAHCVRDGMVRTYDVLALPTASRWGSTLIGAYVNERAANTISWMRSSRRPTTPSCRWSRCATPTGGRSISRSCTTTGAPSCF